jgi:hypothetical protein
MKLKNKKVNSYFFSIGFVDILIITLFNDISKIINFKSVNFQTIWYPVKYISNLVMLYGYDTCIIYIMFVILYSTFGFFLKIVNIIKINKHRSTIDGN